MKKLLLYISIITVLAGMGSCKKFLETLPDNRAVITNPAQVSQLLTTAYPHATYMLFCEAMSDNAEDKGNSGVGADPQTFLLNTQSFRYEDPQDISPDSPIAYWNACYAAIGVANQALGYCGGPDSANYSAQKGEALLCRAYAHFMLVTLFAKAYDPATAGNDPGVPYITAVSKTVFRKFDRSTVAAVYAHIENDLLTGLPLLQDNVYGDAPKFHFTMQAAHAFAARFYLFKRDYAKVVEHTTAVFGSTNPAALIRNQVKFYKMSYNQMIISYNNSSNPANILLQEAPASRYPGNYATCRYGFGTGLRVKLFVGANVTGGDYAVTVYGASPQVLNFPKFGANINVMSLFSMDEVLLNRTEAYIRLKNYDAAIADLNTWVGNNVTDLNPASKNVTPKKMTNFYGTSLDSSMLQTTLDFKRITYLQEGLRWLDILRLNIPVTHTGSADFNTILVAGDKRRLLQLPPEALDAGMALNPR